MPQSDSSLLADLRAAPPQSVAPAGSWEGALLLALVDGMAEAVFAKDRAGRYLLINAAGARALGRSRESILGLDDTALFSSDTAAQLMANDQAAMALGRSEQFEESVTIANHTVVHLVSKHPFRDTTGAVAGLICIAKDILAHGSSPETEAERLAVILEMQQAVANASLAPEEVMRRIAMRSIDLLHGTGAGVFLAEEDGLACKVATGSVAGLQGTTVGMSTSLVGRAFMDSAALRCRDTANDSRVDPAIYRRLGIGSAIVVPLRAGLHTIGVLAVVQAQAEGFSDTAFQTLLLIGGVLSSALARAEIFERNRKLLAERTAALAALSANEEQFRSAVDAAGLGVWNWDIDSGEVTWLGHHEELFGMPRGSFDRRYETFIQAVHPEDREAVVQAIQAALASGKEYSHLHRVLWPDGTVRWIMARGEFHFDALGKATRMVGAVMDVTERRTLESQLLQAQKIEAIGHLAAGIAHEINTPIQYVADNLRFLEDAFGGISEVLAAARSSDAAADPGASAMAAAWARVDGDYLATQIPLATSQALQGAERVADIVRAMKEFSHPGQAEMAPVDLNHAISNTVEVSRSEWRYVADLDVELAADLPLVTCQQGEIQQVILNLVVNAAHAIADAHREARGRITIVTRRVDDQVEIDVRDTGTGIPEAIQPNVFDPFFTTKGVGRGTGQGLALAHDTVVVKHRGTLTFATVPGQGTTFTIRLPVRLRGAEED